MAVPTIVQWATWPWVEPAGAGPWTSTIFHLPNLTLAGNCLVCFFNINTSIGTHTISDDVNGSWGAAIASAAGPNGQTTYIYLFPNGAKNASKITLSYGSTSLSIFGSMCFFEANNIATSSPSDGSSVKSISATTAWATNSITTAADGDLIVACAFVDGSGPPSSGAVSFTAGATFTLLASSLSVGIGMEWRIQATHGANTPAMTLGASVNGVMGAIALKSAAAGTAGSGMRILGRQGESLHSGTPPYSLQFPYRGNLLIADWQSAAAPTGTIVPTIKSITDSQGNPWVPASDTTSFSISAISESSTTVTVTTSVDHGYTQDVDGGDIVQIQGCATAGYNGIWAIASVPTTTTFTFKCNVSGLASDSTGTVTRAGIFSESNPCPVQIFYSQLPKDLGAGTVTVTNEATATGNFACMHFFDVAGADSTPFDGIAFARGNQGSTGDLVTTTINTQRESSGIVFTRGNIFSATVHDLVGLNFQSDTVYTTEDSGANIWQDTDDQTGHALYSGQSSLTFTWTNNAVGGVGTWAAVAVAMQAAKVMSVGSFAQLTHRPGRTAPGVPR